MKSALRALLAVVTVGLGLALGAMPSPTFALRAPNSSHALAHAPAIQVQSQWSITTPGIINMSSPNVANLPGGAAVVVGDESGFVDAHYLANGGQVPGWPYSAGSPVESTPSVASTQAGGLDSVFVGVGNTTNPFVGGYYGITPQGGSQWFVNAANPTTDPSRVNGVRASLAVGNLQGQTDVVGGSMGQNMYALNASSGSVLSGFPWFQADSSFATSALADLYGNGQTDIIEGNDSSAGSAYKTQYVDGGSLRIVSPNGNTGQQYPNGGLVCQYNTNQVVQSSPAVGDFLANGAQTGIVVGFGQYYQGVSNTNQLIAIDANCNLKWVATLDNNTVSSPVLASVLGNGQLQIVENTGSTIWALNGSNGQAIWSTPVSSSGGSPATADLTGDGYQDVIVNTYSGTEILDGRTGQVVTTIPGGGGGDNSPLVTDDANGSIGITVAGGSQISHYEVAGSNGSLVNGAGAWPMFHHDAQLTGNAGAPPIPNLQVPCHAPIGTPRGYDMTGSDGGIFTFGNLPFCGSTGAITLNQPVVGIANTHDDGGYWTVARDGGMFAFGDAKFYGSMGGKPLNAPIVGMAATADGNGYWEVASDGGLFAFGDATFRGSMGGQPLNKPIVGMAATADGNGYWEVASDGGLFAFGDAAFHGSMGGQPLNQPIVGMAATADGNGYWEVASDGGLFAFGDATFHGSMGGQPLNQPIVAMAATPDGDGYWEVASDGGFFAFGDAQFFGSMGGQPLNKPIVGMAAA